jgi:hypothetical protein
MESRRHRARVTFLAALTVLCAATPAGASNRGDDVRAATNDNGVDIVFTRNEDGSGTGRTRSGTSTCTWTSQPVDPLRVWGESLPPQPDQDARLYAVYCDDEYRGLAWLGPSNFAAPATQPLTEELVRRIEVLPADVDVRPEARGVTGIPSLFWVEGYDGAPITESLTAFGLTVTVNATMTEALWDFGDGTPPVPGTLGEAWPQRSSVRHNYANPSPDAGYRVTVRVTLSPSFTVNGGAPTTLDPIVLTFTRTYEVNEVQAVRNA